MAIEINSVDQAEVKGSEPSLEAILEGEKSMKFGVWGAIGSLVASLVAMTACLGPIILVVFGVGGAGFLVRYAQYKPYFILLTAIFLGLGFYITYRKKSADAAAFDPCIAQSLRRNKIVLWIASGLVILFLSALYLVPIYLNTLY